MLRAPKGDGYGTIMLAMFERLGVVAAADGHARSRRPRWRARRPTSAARFADVDRALAPKLIVVTRSATAAVLQEPLDGEIAMIRRAAAGQDPAGIDHPVRDTEMQRLRARRSAQIVDHYAQDGHRADARAVGQHHRPVAARLPRSRQRRVAAAHVRRPGIRLNAVVPLGASPADLRTIGRAWLNVTDRATNSRCRRCNCCRTLRDPSWSRRPVRRDRHDAVPARTSRSAARSPAQPRRRTPRATRSLRWYARTVDAHALSGKRVAVFGMPSAAAGIARVLREELDMRVDFVGHLRDRLRRWLRARAGDLTGRAW